jgi:hypothetical protein
MAKAKAPAKLDDLVAIAAELALAVYDARRLARLQLLGKEPAPEPSERALTLWRRGTLRPAKAN